MENYRNLIVWQKSMQLVKEIYKLLRLMPNYEQYALSDQMRRAAV
jgi:four helix bundle protein